jgi:hypothetical protein
VLVQAHVDVGAFADRTSEARLPERGGVAL